MKTNAKPTRWLWFLWVLLIPIVSLALGVGATRLLNIGLTDYGNLVINLFFLLACVGLIRALKFSRGDLGLRIIKEQTSWHVIISLLVFLLYVLFYLFAIRISDLKPFSPSIAWGLTTYLVVAIAEELYFRGMLYGFLEKRSSGRTALIVTSLLFGLYHVRQGLGGAASKVLAGWLWGSVRYSSGMIFLIIVPIHFAYNATWLLFEGNWSSPPVWATYGLPAVELGLGLIITMVHNYRSPGALDMDKESAVKAQ